MHFAEFPQQNTLFRKPADMTEEQCGDLPVHRGAFPDGTPCIISCWKVTPEDLERIKETGEVWLSIVGSGMPPVSVFTENPFAEPV